jgi:hypothetical protein
MKDCYKDEIRIRDLYVKSNIKTITIGFWDRPSLEILSEKEIKLLYRFLIDKIIKMKLSK